MTSKTFPLFALLLVCCWFVIHSEISRANAGRKVAPLVSAKRRIDRTLFRTSLGMDFNDLKRLSEMLAPRKHSSSDSEDDDLPGSSPVQRCWSNAGKDTKIVTKESTKDDPNYGKIVALQTDEEKMKSIWKAEEVVVVPEALDVVADARVRPEYDVKYKQYVGVEDTFLQMGPKTPLTSSCEAMVIDVKMPGDRMSDVCTDVTEDAVEVRSAKYRLHVPFPHGVHKQMSKATWNSSTSTLTVTVFLKREFDTLNF